MVLKIDNNRSLNLFRCIIRKILFLWQPLHCTGTGRFNLKIDYPSPYLKKLGTIKKQVPTLLEEQLTISCREKLFLTLLLTRMFQIKKKKTLVNVVNN